MPAMRIAQGKNLHKIIFEIKRKITQIVGTKRNQITFD